MKKNLLFLCFLIPFSIFSQNLVEWSDDFSDGDFTHNPTWSGMTENFIINSEKQLQSNASTASKSYLSTPSEAFEDAVWEFWVRINYTTSSSNYAMVYLIADQADISGEVNGYYVQIGNTADEISLYRQLGNMRTKIIDGVDKSIDTNPVIVNVRVTRDKEGAFSLYRKRHSDNEDFNDIDFVQEGETIIDNEVKGSKYFGVLFSNSNTTGKAYHFDDIYVKGEKFADIIPPEWIDLQILGSNKLVLTFSEEVDFSNAVFKVDNGMGNPVSVVPSNDGLSVTLNFATPFEGGILYTVEALNIKDLAGNPLINPQKQIWMKEPAAEGDIVINELLFDHSENAAEYFEIYNQSNKIFDLSQAFFATRNSAGNFSTNNTFPKNTLFLPGDYLALTPEPEMVKEAYYAPETANILKPDRWSALNNTEASFLVGIFNEADTVVLDEVRYNTKWHHTLVKNPKGVSLERINPELPSQSPSSWHSAGSEVRYGTPGYKNSQYRDLEIALEQDKWVWVEPEAFSPDNDGIDDVCFIRYKTEAVGYTANVIIFNSVGVKIKQLVSNYLLTPDGVLLWDGKTDREQNVNPGIYVLYFEMTNVDNGVKKVEKLPLIVSAR